jgi:tricarballylate dehydrogenase
MRGCDVVIVGAGNAAFCAAHAAGVLVGGLFYHNYPGGSGLTSGAVFGRRAGATAAAYVGARKPGFRNLAEEDLR